MKGKRERRQGGKDIEDGWGGKWEKEGALLVMLCRYTMSTLWLQLT
jgi:hypothetical protein